MFQKGYLLNELRRRWGRTLVTALGLAVGVGLVIGIIGVSQGLGQAQDSVLSPLQAIGTDILVTRVAGATQTAKGAGGGTAAQAPGRPTPRRPSPAASPSPPPSPPPRSRPPSRRAFSHAS